MEISEISMEKTLAHQISSADAHNAQLKNLTLQQEERDNNAMGKNSVKFIIGLKVIEQENSSKLQKKKKR